ncbi:two-component response regulator ORR2-like isoform X2 [Dioscorea cayenensis subsp. rotundata]|uniref:Two-component response regulator ORR2-like isoform X2 n=1 Tax=Dioscorea cayennensis subsp. rotundata TaxID=55577 RepID=A0AB40BBM5_DIOCR|nr:two-component response regulator ORR2-like isoform X2 [Dioscorea cayenensis subsp. rotundata]
MLLRMRKEEEEVKQVEEEEEEKVRVLVVDDSPLDRRIVEMMLNRCGGFFEVIAVESGVKAIEVLGLNEGKADCPIVNVQKIDIILTDYCMPGMTGYDLLKAVKENNHPGSIPVVIMSSENDPQRIKSCQAVGAEDFFLKPLKVQDMQSLKSYAKPTGSSPITGTKRKVTLDLIAEADSSGRRPRLAGVAVA